MLKGLSLSCCLPVSLHGVPHTVTVTIHSHTDHPTCTDFFHAHACALLHPQTPPPLLLLCCMVPYQYQLLCTRSIHSPKDEHRHYPPLEKKQKKHCSNVKFFTVHFRKWAAIVWILWVHTRVCLSVWVLWSLWPRSKISRFLLILLLVQPHHLDLDKCVCAHACVCVFWWTWWKGLKV